LVTPAGVRKIPEPIVMPTTTAIALQSPSCLGSVSTAPVVPVNAGAGGAGLVACAILYGSLRSRAWRAGGGG